MFSNNFADNWIKKLANDETCNIRDAYSEYLLKYGFSEENAKLILNNSYDNALRAGIWSHHNIALGKKSSRFALLSLFTGIIKQWFFPSSNEGEVADSPHRPLALSILNSLFRSQRNLNQYKIYSLPDDDAAMNVYQADVYGNKIAGSLAHASTFMERNINPYLVPISEILPSNVGECFRRLVVIPTSLWWRARMPAYINQEFFTDFLKYMLHKPLAVFGMGNSREEVRGIRERGNLKWGYFVDRHKENLGISDKRDEIASSDSSNLPRNDDIPSSPPAFGETPRNDKTDSLARKFLSTLEQCFNKDPTVQMESSKCLGEFLAPVLGMYSFFTSAVGNTSNALFRLFNIENKMSGLANLIQTSSLFSQQLIYLPKIIIPFYSETKQIENILNSLKGSQTKDVSPCNETNEKQKIEELKTLVRDRKITSDAGMFGFCLHGINLTLKTLSVTTSTFPRIIDESACGLTNYFFSSRRYAMGEQFRIENPEFYEA